MSCKLETIHCARPLRGRALDSADSASTAQSSTILVNRTAADGGELSRLPRSDRLTSRVDVSRRTWDIAWPWLPARPDRPSFVESARNTVSKSSPRQRGMAVATAIGLLVAAALAIYSRAAPAVDPERLVVSQWLDAQVAGGTGSDFMQPRTGSVRIYFHNLQSWRITSQPRPHQFAVEATSETPEGELAIDRCQVTVAGVVQPNGIRRQRVVDVKLFPQRKRQQ